MKYKVVFLIATSKEYIVESKGESAAITLAISQWIEEGNSELDIEDIMIEEVD